MFTAVIDIGTPGKSLGWAAVDASGVVVDGTDIDICICSLVQALHQGPAALGFEAPLWIPTRMDPKRLTSARPGEAGPGLSRSFSASAGATALVAGIVVVTYVLRRLRDQAPKARAQFDWRNPPTGVGELLVWEAFVTNQKKTHDARHVEDAKLAIEAFQQGMKDPSTFESAVVEADCLSLVDAALIEADWTKDLEMLTTPCQVVRAH